MGYWLISPLEAIVAEPKLDLLRLVQEALFDLGRIAPKLFSYPEPPAISEEERRRYEDVARRLPKPKRKAQRR